LHCLHQIIKCIKNKVLELLFPTIKNQDSAEYNIDLQLVNLGFTKYIGSKITSFKFMLKHGLSKLYFKNIKLTKETGYLHVVYSAKYNKIVSISYYNKKNYESYNIKFRYICNSIISYSSNTKCNINIKFNYNFSEITCKMNNILYTNCPRKIFLYYNKWPEECPNNCKLYPVINKFFRYNNLILEHQWEDLFLINVCSFYELKLMAELRHIEYEIDYMKIAKQIISHFEFIDTKF